MWVEVSNDDELFLLQQYASTATTCFDFEGVRESEAVRKLLTYFRAMF